MDPYKMKFILDNLIDQKQCQECLGIWFTFNDRDNVACYRLSPVAPEDCTLCVILDKELVEKSIATSESWVSA